MKINKIINYLEPFMIIFLIPIFVGGVLPVWRASRNANNSLIYLEGNREGYEEAFVQIRSELYLQQWITMLLLLLVILYAAVTHYRPVLERSFIWGAGLSVPAFVFVLLTQAIFLMDGGANPLQEEYRSAANGTNSLLFFSLIICYIAAYIIQRKKGNK